MNSRKTTSLAASEKPERKSKPAAVRGAGTSVSADESERGNPAIGAMTIEPARFCKQQGRLSGTIPATQLLRLTDFVTEQPGKVDYELLGSTDEYDHPALQLNLSVDVTVLCQRCLQGLHLEFETSRQLVLVPGVREFDSIENEDQEIDTIPLSSTLDVRDLIDQEVVLSLPIAAYHPQGDCRADVGDQGPAEASPFAVLAQFRK